MFFVRHEEDLYNMSRLSGLLIWNRFHECVNDFSLDKFLISLNFISAKLREEVTKILQGRNQRGQNNVKYPISQT